MQKKKRKKSQIYQFEMMTCMFECVCVCAQSDCAIKVSSARGQMTKALQQKKSLLSLLLCF